MSKVPSLGEWKVLLEDQIGKTHPLSKVLTLSIKEIAHP
jgi:hypothetical protein